MPLRYGDRGHGGCSTGMMFQMEWEKGRVMLKISKSSRTDGYHTYIE